MNFFDSLSKWIKLKFQNENEKTEDNTLQYKLLVLGDPGVGKSSICTRFCKNNFNLEIKSNEICECHTKTLKLFENIIKLFIIDVDKNILNRDRSNIYANVKGALIIYDITKRKSFEKIENWIIDLKQNTKQNLPIFIVGNKTDLTFLRSVDPVEAEEKSKLNNCEFYETSCIENDSVSRIFKLLVSLIYFRDLPDAKKNYFKMFFSTTSIEDNQKKDEILIEK